MESTTSKACKYILTTYEDGNTNHFYDSTFHLRVPFKPNNAGQYKVTINECLFRNDEPTLRKGDYYEFIVDDGTVHTCRFTAKRDIYVYGSGNEDRVTDMLKKASSAAAPLNMEKSGEDIIKTIEWMDSDGNTSTETWFGRVCDMDINLKNVTVANVKSVKMMYSNNFGYMFNKLIANPINGKATTTAGEYKFQFAGIRFGGPYLFVLKTPLQSSVPTYNAINQGYNVVALTYNNNSYGNSVNQMCSSMEVTANDLSGLRLELVDDQYEHVHVLSPVYIQITVSNE